MYSAPMRCLPIGRAATAAAATVSRPSGRFADRISCSVLQMPWLLPPCRGFSFTAGNSVGRTIPHGKSHGGRNDTGRLERLELERGARSEAEDAKGSGGGKPHKKRKKGGAVGSRQQLADAMTKGKLLTTPSKLFKLLIPLTTSEESEQDHRQSRDVEPIAILVHPQQPLSQLKQLIQNEIPPIAVDQGRSIPPEVSFLALQIDDNPILPRKAIYEATDTEVNKLKDGGAGKYRAWGGEEDADNQDDPYTYLHQTAPEEKKRFVRWSQATEIGDFVRDASRAREFVVSVEGAPTGLRLIHVEVPTFNERTHFLRMRLRKISDRIKTMAEVKHECDALAQRGAQRVAICGFGILASWWCLVYKLTFGTDLGWDTMEPVTYLVSLSTLMGGYLWFLYHNREISYRSALDFTISARQKKLYQAKDVDLHLWASLIDEGNMLRREIKTIAAEYDVVWDETKDERDERVTEALKKQRNDRNGSPKEDDGDD
ncbi:uncharacterized protein BDW47DRAFT_29779 [Aspergillus candidus]|uniref:Calcium uniporter protein n=1 Tax=Aspergillus candidus TaxID=41067 RepID=A0A2I2FC49_ASPCN|nr:hypothetical protein BDW47DRAFT_29779 [Aspergillus candidus]PLB38216.1 hypothetical protein BDW47DRAFT_29779 [Aspergillus candidus]